MEGPLIWNVEIMRGMGYPPACCHLIRILPPKGARWMVFSEVRKRPLTPPIPSSDGGQMEDARRGTMDDHTEDGDDEEDGWSSGSSHHLAGHDEEGPGGVDDSQGGVEEAEEVLGGAVEAPGHAVEGPGGPREAPGGAEEDNGEAGEAPGGAEDAHPHGYMAYGEWKHFDYHTTGVTHFVAHHKNDR